MRLTEGEQARMRELGADSCRALEDSVRTVTVGDDQAARWRRSSHRDSEVDGIFPYAIFAGGGQAAAQLTGTRTCRRRRSSTTRWW